MIKASTTNGLRFMKFQKMSEPPIYMKRIRGKVLLCLAFESLVKFLFRVLFSLSLSRVCTVSVHACPHLLSATSFTFVTRVHI